MTVTVTEACPTDDDDEASILAFGVDAATHRAIRRAAEDHGVSPSVFLRTAIAILLHRMDATADRPTTLPRPYRVDLSGDPTSREALARARAADLAGRLSAETTPPLSLRRLLRPLGQGEGPGPAERLKQVLVPMLVAPDLPISEIEVLTDAECQRRRQRQHSPDAAADRPAAPNPDAPTPAPGPTVTLHEAGWGRREPARDQRIPLSTEQRGVWALGRMRGQREPDNGWWVVRLRGALDIDALRSAARDVVGLHEPLRTRYPERDGEPCQEVLDADAVRDPLDVVDAVDRDVEALLADAVRRPFDLQAEPPFRMVLFTVAPGEYVLLHLFHRIAVDPASQGPFLWDLQAAYTARRAGTAPTWPPLPLRYADHAVRQRALLGADDPRGRAARRRAFWTRELADLPETIALPTIPSTVPGSGGHPQDTAPPARSPATRTDTVGVVRTEIPTALARSLPTFARDHGSTPATVIRAAVAVLLHRLGAGEDIPLTALITDRADEALGDAVGMFQRPVVLRAGLSGTPCFGDVVDRVQTVARTARAHADLPLDQVADASAPTPAGAPHRAPLLQVTVSHATRPERPRRLFGLDTVIDDDGSSAALGELEFAVVDEPEEGRSILTLRYAADRFDRSAADTIVARLLRLLSQCIAHPRRPIGDLEATPGEKRQDSGRSAVILILPERSPSVAGGASRPARVGGAARDAGIAAVHRGTPHPTWRFT
ncbi:condensation domain-containing protein [Nocardiopsis gilva]|nr:condensation domain-containing protein [Nocardiopsis gilva]